MLYMDRLPIFCQQINQTIRAQTVGKAATFSKVCRRFVALTKTEDSVKGVVYIYLFESLDGSSGPRIRACRSVNS
jgi:hypothetical protein